MKRILFLVSILTLLLCSCSSNRDLAYFSKNTPDLGQVAGNTDWKLKIVPDDELAITVMSEVPQATSIYNLPLVNTGSKETMSETISTNTALQTYIVDKEGYIKFPKFGRIHVEIGRAHV